MKSMGLGSCERPARTVESEKEGEKDAESVQFEFGKREWGDAKGWVREKGWWYIASKLS